MRGTERMLRDMGLNLAVVQAAKHGAMTGLSVGDAERRGGGLFLITQIERSGGETVHRPAATILIHEGDTLTLVTRGSRVTVGAMFELKPEAIRAGRTTFRV